MWHQSCVALVALLPSVLAGITSPLPVLPKGVPRIFNIVLTWQSNAPDGFSRDMILMNGQYPGPLLEMNQGEDIQVIVQNQTPFNTTMHYHGIEQYLTPWSDGVPGVTQKYIKPGESFQYAFSATQYGSYWYHAHERGQLDDGMYGPIVIHPAAALDTPFSTMSSDAATVAAMTKAVAHVQPLVLSDLRHRTSADAWNIEVASGMELPCFDSLLINGHGQVDCMSADEIASLLTPQQKQFLKLGNATAFTAKGCMPASVISGVLAKGESTTPSAVPSDVFDVCTPTTGSQAVIKVTQKSCETQKWLALDVIGTYGLLTTVFSIDQLPLWVYAVDGEYITPQRVDAITVTNGDRFSVLVNLTAPGDYTIRHASSSATQIVQGTGTLSFRTESGNPAPFTTPTVPYIAKNALNTSADVVFFNQAQQKAFPPQPVGQTADATFKVDMRVAGQSYNWALNGTIFSPAFDAQDPLLFKPEPYIQNNVTITTTNNTWVDLIFVTATWPMPPHPIHKHGNKMYLIGEGQGYFNWSTTAEAMAAIPQSFNLVDPPVRDGFATPQAVQGPAWMVVRYHVTNPGAWLLHCHIQSHLLGGMEMVIQDGIDVWPTVPQQYLNYS